MLLLIQAGSGSVGYTVLLIAGMSFASAVDAGVIAGTLPAVAALLALLVLKECPDRTVVGAIALASAGILFVTVPFKGASGGLAPAALLGNALVLGAITCEAAFVLLHKKLRTPIAPLPLSTAMTGLGFALAAGPAALEQPWTISLSAASIAGVVYYALVPTVGGFLLWYAGSMRVSAGEASLLTALAPVSAVALAAAVLRETIGTNQLIGMSLVTSAVLLAAAQAGIRSGQPEPSEAGSASAPTRRANRA